MMYYNLNIWTLGDVNASNKQGNPNIVDTYREDVSWSNAKLST